MAGVSPSQTIQFGWRRGPAIFNIKILDRFSRNVNFAIEASSSSSHITLGRKIQGCELLGFLQNLALCFSNDLNPDGMLYAIDSLLIYDITENNFKVLVLRVAAAHSKSWKEHRGKGRFRASKYLPYRSKRVESANTGGVRNGLVTFQVIATVSDVWSKKLQISQINDNY